MLREKTDETNVRMSSMAQELESLRQSIASQPPAQAVMPQPGGAGAVPDPSLPPGTVTTPPSVQPPSNVGISPQRMYDASYDDYSSARYDLAIQGFQNFIATFPRLPQAADAQYNVGMSYFNQAKWMPTEFTFIGENAKGDHVRVHYFPGARAPLPT